MTKIIPKINRKKLLKATIKAIKIILGDWFINSLGSQYKIQ